MQIESILLAVVHIGTYLGEQGLSNATGFYFKREDGQIFLITNLHVVKSDQVEVLPDRLKITLHSNDKNLAETSEFVIPLYDADNQPVWREATDKSGKVDVVAIPLEPDKFPAYAEINCFTNDNLLNDLKTVEIGQSIRVVGYPLSFQDTLHSLPVMRHAIIASSFNLRFMGNGYFLTDSVLHRGSSGSPVVMRSQTNDDGRTDFPWILLGVHSARLNARRDPKEDERLSLFAAWYADVILTLIEN